MKNSSKSSSGKISRRTLSMRITQKPRMNYVKVGASVFGVLLGAFIYFNFSHSAVSRAENALSAYHPTYTTVDMVVPVRLLLKPDAIARGISNYKNDTGYVAKKFGRGEIISVDRYIAD